MPDYPTRPALAVLGRVASFVFDTCCVLIAGVGTGWLVWRIVEVVR